MGGASGERRLAVKLPRPEWGMLWEYLDRVQLHFLLLQSDASPLPARVYCLTASAEQQIKPQRAGFPVTAETFIHVETGARAKRG